MAAIESSSDVPQEPNSNAETPNFGTPQETGLDTEKPSSSLIDKSKMVCADKATTLEEIYLGINQETGLGTSSSQQESVQINIEGHRSNETNERTERSKLLNQRALLQATIQGDWQTAKSILDKDPEAARIPITNTGDIALHIAITAKQDFFAKELLRYMSPEDLEFKNQFGHTAFYNAAEFGVMEIAKEMMNVNNELLFIPSSEEKTPIQIAAFCGNREMTLYLFSLNPFEKLTPAQRIDLFSDTISSNMFDIALEILKKDMTLATAKDRNGEIALQLLARKASWIGSKIHLSAWEKFLNSWSNRICSKSLMQTLAHQLVELLWTEVQRLPANEFKRLLNRHSSFLCEAAKLGNAEFLTILIRSYPLIVKKIIRDKEVKQTIFDIALSYRQESVFSLMHEYVAAKNSFACSILENGNNKLHLAGTIAPSNRLNIISGAALQMQRELLWFKEIEKLVPPSYLEMKNSEGKTAQEVFTETHNELRKEGEKWMKDTANYCMLVATLIATMVFAVAFTIPGDNSQDTGALTTAFFISDALAVISSSTSILIFLSILTSCYREKDFLKSLPTKLVLGVTTLFISIIGMLVTFGAAYFLVYKHKGTRVPTAMLALAGIPVTLFVVLHHNLWVDIICSTFLSRLRFRRENGIF